MKKGAQLTGAEWADTLSISIRDKLSHGFGNSNYFHKQKISKEEFLNRLIHCDVVKPENLTRREAAIMKQNLLKKIN